MRISRRLALLLLGLPLRVFGDFNLIQGVNAVQPLPTGRMPVTVVVNGSGKCGEMEIDWGDDARSHETHVDLASRPKFTHSYEGGGGKTVTVIAKTGCEGWVRTRFVIEPSVFQLGFAQVQKPTAQVCNQVPNLQAVRPNTLVHISAPAGMAVNFGCPLNSCIYNADGRRGDIADSRFPFPGFTPFSLVLRVGDEKFQGGTQTSFVARSGGLLEVCLNDSNPSQHTGGFRVDIRQDQLGPNR
jgi:hypothetical protein